MIRIILWQEQKIVSADISYFYTVITRCMDFYEQIFSNNRDWVESKLESDGHFFEKLAREQKPQFLYNGLLKDLNVNLGEYFSAIRKIYDLNFDL
jgi:hypothetical protein